LLESKGRGRGLTVWQHEETFGDDGYVYGIDYGVGFTEAYLFPTYQVVYMKYVQLLCISHTSTK